jgi:hypothetical protein
MHVLDERWLVLNLLFNISPYYLCCSRAVRRALFTNKNYGGGELGH